MLTQIIVHLFPHEIDQFGWQSKQLKQGSYYLDDNDKVLMDVTLNLNLVNWNESTIPKEYFIEKFNNLKKLYDWADIDFTVDEKGLCLGCNDKRRDSINKSTSDNIIYLDADVIFNSYTLNYLIEASKEVKDEYYIITPQVPKMWDNTWDPLVNKKFMDMEPSQETYKSFDVYNLIQQSDFSLKTFTPHPYADLQAPLAYFKMGGGWFNIMSTNLLKYITIPPSLGSYGLDDTFILICAGYMKLQNFSINQYIIENLIVSEDHKYYNNPYSKYLKEIKYKGEFGSIKENFYNNALKSFDTEYFKFVQRTNPHYKNTDLNPPRMFIPKNNKNN